jgi:hypothetical protein
MRIANAKVIRRSDKSVSCLFWSLLVFLDEKANHGYLTYFYGLNSHFLNAGDSVAQPRA